MIEFKLKDNDTDPYIELNKLLKATHVCESGAMANQCIIDEMITVNGKTETRKRAKIRKNSIVKFEDNIIKVI